MACAMAAVIPQARPLATISAFILLVAFAGFRLEIGWDYENYQYFYEAVSGLAPMEVLAADGPANQMGFEPGFSLLIWLINAVGADYQFTLAILTIGLCIYAAYRLAPEALPVFFVAYLLNGYFHNFSILRQGLAGALVFCLFTIYEKRKGVAWGGYLAASAIHLSAIFLSPLIAVCIRFSTKKILLCTLALCWVMSVTSINSEFLSFVLTTSTGRGRWRHLLEINALTGKVGVSFILVEYTLLSCMLVAIKINDKAVQFARGILIFRLLVYGLLNDISIAWERSSAFADPMYAAALAITLTMTVKRVVPDIQLARLCMLLTVTLVSVHVIIKYDRMLGSEPRVKGERSHYERFIPYRSIFDS